MKPPYPPPRMTPAPPTKQERQAQLREYLASLERLRQALIDDLRTALVGLGLTPEVAGDLAVEAVGVALARGATRKVLDWLKG
jgi:hypothetical protein